MQARKRSPLKFTKLYNFRDVCREGSKIKPGRLYRGANLCYSSPEDAKFIAEELKVKTLIDLRRAKERGGSAENGVILGPLNQYYLGAKKGNRNYHSIPLTATTNFSLAILGSTSLYDLVGSFTKGLFKWDFKEVERGITKSALGGKSLEEVYVLFLLNTQTQIYKVLMVLLEETNYPAVLFCSGGKDRTALLTMLVQGCCGEDPEVVIESYHESGQNLQIVADQLREENERDGLDPIVFGQTPKEAMEKLLEFINKQWGGISGYLIDLGFDEDKQKRLREILTQ